MSLKRKRPRDDGCEIHHSRIACIALLRYVWAVTLKTTNRTRSIYWARKAAAILMRHKEIRFPNLLCKCAWHVSGLVMTQNIRENPSGTWMVNNNYSLGRPWLQHAASQDSIDAFHQLAIRQDEEKDQMVWYRKAMLKGCPEAYELLSVYYWQLNRYTQVVAMASAFDFRVPCGSAKYDLALCNLDGLGGVVENATRGKQLLLEAAQLGYETAIVDYAKHLIEGMKDTRKYDTEIQYWLHKATSQPYPFSETTLLFVDFYSQRNNLPMALYWRKRVHNAVDPIRILELKKLQDKVNQEEKWFQTILPSIKVGNAARERQVQKMVPNILCADEWSTIWEYACDFPSKNQINRCVPPSYVACTKCCTGSYRLDFLNKDTHECEMECITCGTNVIRKAF